ncbi:DUF6017 domain-containing protein [Thomasclavelia ramosa]|uniref:DUF6017 domain-containing protein n=1 Tax=Thomasclavelia ramosa TaxID=1547 RepID=UPI0034A159D1
MPKVLFTNEVYKGLSTDAKILYGLLLDRMNLSAKNEWKDELGRVYIIFTLKEIQESLQCKDNKATKLLNELEKKYDLIERKRLGQGKPCLIYVKNFIVDNYVERHFCNRENNDSAIGNSTSQDSLKSRCNNTELNKIENSDIDPSFFPENPEKTIEEMGSESPYEQYIKEKLEYDSLVTQYKYHVQMLDEIVDIIVDTLNSNRKMIRIGGEDKPTEIVKSQFMKLENRHIQLVMDNMLANTTKIKNIRQYLLTTLYNTMQTNGSF